MVANTKPSVLILGVLDPTSAHVVRYIVETGAAGQVRVATFNPLATCRFSTPCANALARVECMQTNPNQPESLNAAFKRSQDQGPWDYVFFFGDMRPGQSEQIYRLRISEPAQAVAQKARAAGVKLLVYLSSSLFYEKNSISKPNTEDAPMKPAHAVHRAINQLEKAMNETQGLCTIGLRSAITYGPEMYGKMFVPIAVARVHQELGDPVHSLVPADAPHHMVHINDLARAFWHTAQWRSRTQNLPEKLTFNVAQPIGNDPGRVASILESIFGVKTIFHNNFIGKAMSLAATLLSFQDDLNERLLGPWSRLLAESNIEYTPVSPYIEKELLGGNKFSIDGTRITKMTEFKYKHAAVTEEEFREAIREAQQMRFWPIKDIV
ncbi:hypothetical protein THASP1DRAFT_30557 [Thamnocephalis sphaerospora]|uniref:NAD-dependent epimerase/dehydratase domain-containing protein n=1 Tax=Thamnocephalis sphaerospora TaxID=78915 RepID=A0A4P9XP45_9FUNG|nr:hypothetical protein THASP1DRAFT_30557 [Thamnocephalis sphaerospora]|eukprot:RKP07632.1 hypothetical protein THASP1DRAFT_30557 [Thamnocephalis sphaerospora]